MTRVVTAVYGERHWAFVLALLESLARLPAPPPTVLVWDALPGVDVRRAAAGYPFVRPVTCEAERSGGSRDQRIAEKVWFWLRGARAVCAEAEARETVVFLDADTLVRGLGEVLEPYDLAVTAWAPGRWSLNSGVVAARAGIAESFVRLWHGAVRAVAGWDPALARARYGAVDQAALAMAVAAFEGGTEPTAVIRLDAGRWNNPVLRRDAERAQVLHYKGCLPLLLRERPYGPAHGDDRDPATCEPWFDVWREHHAAALRRLGGPLP